jgi:ubiquitin-activating enzyme E1
MGVEIAKNLILAGPKSVALFDPEIVRVNDLGANFYCEEKHIGKVSRAEACLEKLAELNPNVSVSVVADAGALEACVTGNLNVLCQTEMIINGQFWEPEKLNQQCRASNCGYIFSHGFGPWGCAFVDYGPKHVVNDHDGEQTKNFIVIMIEKGEQTKVMMHEDKRHIFQEGDYVVFREVEGMTEINEAKPIKVVKTTNHSVTLDLNSTTFSDYSR